MNTSEIINTTESDMASPYKSSAQKGTPSKIKEIQLKKVGGDEAVERAIFDLHAVKNTYF